MLIGSRKALMRRPPQAVAAGYTAYGVSFDGTNDYMSRGAGLTGAADGQKGICSFWVNFTGGDGNFQIIFEDNDQLNNIYRDNSNKLTVSMKNGAGIGMFGVTSGTTFNAAAGWKHVLISWDGTGSVGTNNAIYVNDTSDATPSLDGGITIDYTKTNWGFGHRLTGSLICQMEIADFYLNFGESLDLSSSSNRRKFITAGLRPVDLGSDGSTPTGTQPIVFFKGSSGVPGDFATNLGSGGSFSLTGTLTAAGSNP